MSLAEKLHCAAAAAREKWRRVPPSLIGAAIVLVSALSLMRLAKAYAVLLWDPMHGGGVDTNIFHRLIHRWFASLPVYSELRTAVHPPATYAILWPFVGWLDNTPARWLWAATMLAALVWLVYLAVRESGAETWRERALVALLPLSSYSAAYTARNGQLIVHLLPALLTGLLLLARRRPAWTRDLAAAALILFTLVKPNVSAPFLWLVLFLPGGLRPAALVVLGYAALTLFAASFQELGTFQLVHDSLARGSALAARAGSSNLHALLSAVGLERWLLPFSLLAFLALGLWIYRHRDVDIWLLLAVSAIVARLWAYHRLYDDLLLLLPQLALFRMAKKVPAVGDEDVAAGALLALTAAGFIVPIRLVNLTPLWAEAITAANLLVWIVLLPLFMKQAARERRARLALPELPLHSARKQSLDSA